MESASAAATCRNRGDFLAAGPTYGVAVVVDARPFIDWIRTVYEPACRVGDAVGAYGRSPGRRHAHLYGTSDMACVRWTIGDLDVGEADAWAEQFATFRHDDGTYREHLATHHPWHSTAFALAAMELFDLDCPRPDFLVTDPTAVLDGLDWRDDVYTGSHEGAALASVAALCGVDDAWWTAYWRALEAHLDPATGMFGDGKPPGGDSDQIGGTFHYAFVYEHVGRVLPHAEARVAAVLANRVHDGLWHPENRRWLTLDGVYLLTRSGVDGVADAVRDAVRIVEAESMTEPGRTWFDEWYLGVHDLTATVSTLAEAQRFLGPDEVVTEVPLRLVLDRRPFI